MINKRVHYWHVEVVLFTWYSLSDQQWHNGRNIKKQQGTDIILLLQDKYSYGKRGYFPWRESMFLARPWAVTQGIKSNFPIPPQIFSIILHKIA